MSNIPLNDMYKRPSHQEKLNLVVSKFQELTYKVFGVSVEGVELLKLWKEVYIYQPRFVPQLDPNMGYYRSGQESIVLGIMECVKEQQSINEANKLKEEKLNDR